MTYNEINTKWVYSFGGKICEGNAQMKNLLGGKGAGLAEMSRIGLPVPPGFTITTDACTYYNENNFSFSADLYKQVQNAMDEVERNVKKKFGDPDSPLLVAVRSGARVSMPGMMDTILNLGLNDRTVEGLAKSTNNKRFAFDSYRRFIQMYGSIVNHISHAKFEEILCEQKSYAGVTEDTKLTADDLKEVIRKYKNLFKIETQQEFPHDVYKQL
jgi:pyruvate, orthophosphate dikinase